MHMFDRRNSETPSKLEGVPWCSSCCCLLIVSLVSSVQCSIFLGRAGFLAVYSAFNIVPLSHMMSFDVLSVAADDPAP